MNIRECWNIGGGYSKTLRRSVRMAWYDTCSKDFLGNSLMDADDKWLVARGNWEL